MALSKIQTAEMLDAPNLGRRNHVINGAMEISQRALSATAGNGTYVCLDRFRNWASGAATTVSRQAFTVGQTDVPRFTKYMRCVVGSNSGNGDYSTFATHIEGVEKCDAQTMTLSFYAKASSALGLSFEPIQNFGSGGSGRVLLTPHKFTLSTSWTRYTYTFTWPSISGKTIGGTNHANFELNFWMSAGSSLNSRTGSLGNQAGTFEITGLQIEDGTVATPFEHIPLGETFQLCKRYYEKSFPMDTAPFNNRAGEPGAQGGALWFKKAAVHPPTDSGTYMGAHCPFEAEKRDTATTVAYNPNTVGSVTNKINDMVNSGVTTSYSITTSEGDSMGCRFYFYAASTSGNPHGCHWTADAEIS